MTTINRSKVWYSDVYSIPELIVIGEVKYDGYRKENCWTGLLTASGMFGDVLFYHRVGDFASRQEAEDAVRAEEVKRQKMIRQVG